MKKILKFIFWCFIGLIIIASLPNPEKTNTESDANDDIVVEDVEKEEDKSTESKEEDKKTEIEPGVIYEIKLEGKLEENFKKALKEAKMDFSKVRDFSQGVDWANGPRYQFTYVDKAKNLVYYVYAYEDGQISSITTGTKEIYRNNNIVIENDDAEAITLTYGQLGDYGKYVKFDGKKYMRYVLPAGKYEVSALVRNSMFFIEKTKIYKNSFGYDETKTVSTIDLKEVGETKTITLKKDEWINLTMNSSISIKKSK